MAVPNEALVEMYATMAKIRIFEERIQEIYLEGKTPVFDIAAGPVPGEMHLSAGQEPVAAGVGAHLEPGDAVTATHRPHHIAIAQGVDLPRMTAEIFGKATGLGKGKGGHMHLFSVEPNFGCSGIIGEGIPTACGAALAFKRRGLPNVAVSLFGEGAANQGAFHESLNLASRWGLPAVFVCEDNTWAISVLKEVATAIASNSDRAAAYGMPGIRVRDNDPVAVYEAAGEAIARARAGGGPTLIEVETDRLFGHFEGDPQAYRTPEQLEALRARDALTSFGERLVAQGAATAGELEAIRTRAHDEVDAAVEFARTSPYPEPEEALADVFA